MKTINADTIKKYIEDTHFELYPTQYRLCIPIIKRIYQKMINNIIFDDIKISDDLLIDGHHRYVSSLLAQKNIGQVTTNRSSATKKYEWREVQFVNEEWDTAEKIDKLNKDDAEFNNIPLAVITEMIK